MLALKNTGTSGVYNIGTGKQLTFEDIARLIQKHVGMDNAQIHITPMPDEMVPKYQWESCANLNKLLTVIPDWNPDTVEQWLDKNFETLYNKIREEIL
jgi:nucleoside-diphosphate-sugar epimerase